MKKLCRGLPTSTEKLWRELWFWSISNPSVFQGISQAIHIYFWLGSLSTF
jgi:hypothetical protein